MEEKKIYCAIYCRKSVEERADETFGSIENQHEAILNFIASHKQEGWLPIAERYDDNGFTGSNTNRPSLQRLITDIKEGKVNMIIVYKLDRLSRSLVDFVQILKFFEEYNVSFASVTQPIDTSTSTGKLMLHILSSFAEFERQLISERTRDKMSASKKRGKWVGGRTPLGYDIDKANRRLVINPKEAEIVKEVFNLYLEKKSLLSVAIELNEKSYKTKSYATLEGKKSGGVKFKNTSIQSIVKNPFYIGKVSHEGVLYPGEHERIISDEIFQRAQEILANNRRERKVAGVVTNIGLLNNILRCKSCNSSMFYIYSRKGTNKYHYYLCSNAQKRGYKNCPTRLISAQIMENKFMEFLRTISEDKRIEPEEWETLTIEEKIPIVKSIVKAAHYDAVNGDLEIILHNNEKGHQFALTLAELKHIPNHRRQAGISKHPLIRQNLILAHQIDQISHERICSLKEIAGWIGITHARICHIANMLLIAPKIQEEILLSDDKALFDIPEYMLREVSSEVDWNRQQDIWNSLIKSQQR